VPHPAPRSAPAHELLPEIGAQHGLNPGKRLVKRWDRCDEARLRERMRSPMADDSAWLGILRAARLEIVHGGAACVVPPSSTARGPHV